MIISWWWVALFFATILKHEVVFTDSLIPAQTGGTFGRSSREPKFNIEFHSEDSPFHPDDDLESIVMPNNSGEKFLCFLPKVEKSKSGKLLSPHNISSMVMESETRNKIKTPDELLEVLKKDICFARVIHFKHLRGKIKLCLLINLSKSLLLMNSAFGESLCYHCLRDIWCLDILLCENLIQQEGWWSYEFCPQNKIRQLHIDGDKVLQEFILGVYDSKATEAYNQNLADISTLKDPRSKDASQRYHVHLFTNGTVCDLTNEPRRTEVRFVCSEPKAMISSITELSTCKYALTFQCPMLCKHPLFHGERPVSHTIHCNILSKDNKKESKSEASIFPGGKITMVMDGEFPRSINLEEHAT